MSRLLNILKKYEIWLLRGAVVFPMLWAGTSQLRSPLAWIGFVPQFVEGFVDRETFLWAHSILLIVSGILLLTGPYRWFFALVALANLAGILIFYGLDDITFRDVGLALVALVLFAREYQRHLSSAG